MQARVVAQMAMVDPPVTLRITDTLQAAAASLQEYKEAPVVDRASRVVGVVTAKALMASMIKGLSPSSPIEAVMERPVTIHEQEFPLQKIAFEPNALSVVNDDGVLVGVLHADKWLRKYEEQLKQQSELYKRLLDEESSALFLLEENGEVLYQNEAARELIANGDVASMIAGKATGVIDIDGKACNVKRKKLPTNQELVKVTSVVPAAFDDGEDWKTRAEQMETIVELAHDGIIIVNVEGIITMVSEEYATFLGMKSADMIGKHVTELVENTRMHIVAKTGNAEIADIQRIHGDYMVATRLPIYKDGKLEGAIGKVLFKNLGGFKALRRHMEKLEKELDSYRGEWKESSRAKYRFDQLVGTSAAWQDVKKLAQKAAASDSNVLLLGESGTGKELFAHAIHLESNRALGPFIKVNCAAIPHDLLESELFGYIEGSFTGAKKGGKIGKFEAADGGTIFLDEVGELPLHMQVKLLRVLQEREVERIGATTSKQVDIRVIAATNRQLEEMTKSGEFRLDLYYRLNVFIVQIPPLRERREDIRALVPYFIHTVSRHLSLPEPKLDASTMRVLMDYEWPGNTRELENVVERALNVAPVGATIRPEHLPERLTLTQKVLEPKPLAATIEAAERKALEDAIAFTNGNKSKAAKLLQISRTALYERLAKYQID